MLANNQGALPKALRLIIDAHRMRLSGGSTHVCALHRFIWALLNEG
jgi:hypothetical protein